MLNLFCAQYGSHNSFYGNIQLGRFEPVIQTYGGWPKQKVILKPVPDPAYEPEDEERLVVSAPTIQDNIPANLEIIKRLRAELTANQDTKQRVELREQLHAARAQKEAQFKALARQERDEEEAAFILFN